MKTTKPVSTISFNTEAYLKQKCDELIKAKVIEFYAFVHHKGETDETGPEAVQKKEHNHLFVIPASNLQTEDLREQFKEPDPQKPDIPRGCLPFHKSNNFGDWVLYALHDEAYLAEKGLTKEYHYEYDDIVTSDADELYRLYSSVDMHRLMPYNNIIKAVKEGKTFSEFLNTERVPFKQIGSFKNAWDFVAYDFSRKYNDSKKWNVTEEDRKVSKENLREMKKKKGVLRNEWIDASVNDNPFDEVN